MMAKLCRIFTCKSTKNEEYEKPSSVKSKRSNNNMKADYKQVKKKKNRNIKEVIENLDHINRRVKFTIEADHRYVIPLSFVQQIVEMIKNDEYTRIEEIKNGSFLHKNKKNLKRDLKTSELCLISREIMDCLLEGLDVDYIIKVPYKQEKIIKIRLKEVNVFQEEEFITLKKEKLRNFDQNNNIEIGIIVCKDIQVEIINNLPEEDEDKTEYNEKIEKENEDPDKTHKDEKNIIKIEKNGKKNKNFKDIKVNKKDKIEESDEEKITSTTPIANKLKELNNDGISNEKINKDKINNNDKNSKNTTTKTISQSEKSTTITKKSASSIFINKLESFENLSLKPKGLYNPSVYCFMNTCLQCLVSIPELNHYFASGTYNSDKKSKKGTTTCNALRELIEEYSESSGSLRAPSSIYKVCHSFLEPNQQHDCQEFLRRFLSKIQEELNYNKKYSFPDQAKFEKVWDIYREMNPSFVDSLFAGLMRSSVICNKCGYKSDTYDPFLDLSVPIKKKSVETLENCLDNYFSKEFIDCEYKCSSCKKKTSITKKLEIVISPPILTVHFKRFEDLHHKFNGSIEFTDTLDLLTYTSMEVHDTLNYELFAVAVHLGRSIFSGHYVAYAKRQGKWYNFNDSSVFPAGVDEALSNNAYILFYRRLNN